LNEEFWSQSAVNDWHDHHSPERPLTSPRKRRIRRISSSDEESPFSTPINEAEKPDLKAKAKSKDEKKRFDAQKEKMAADLLAELDIHITAGKIGEMAKETGGVKINWSKKLNSTAGMAHYRRESVMTSHADGTKTKSHLHHASIELAIKVIDDEAKLVNTLAHEFCHLANFMVSGIMNHPHGKEFKEW
jgi:hypothetical protein